MQFKIILPEGAYSTSVMLFVFPYWLLVIDAVGVSPQNEAAVAGGNVTLQCGSDYNDSLQWKHRQLSGEETSLTYDRNITSDHGRLVLNTTINGQYDLQISQVERSDAGTYICIKTEASTADNRSVVSKRYEAQLVVLTSDTNCTVNKITGNKALLENDYVQMQCHFRYVGNLVPVMEWRREGQLMDAAQINTTAGNQIFRSSLLVPFNSSDNGVRFSCDVFFAPIKYNKSSDGLLFRANNTPEYKYKWTSLQLNVWYGPTNLRVLLNNKSNDDSLFGLVTSDDYLECYADGNPTPRYHWTIATNHSNVTVQGPVLCLNELKLSSQELKIECKAVNEIGEKNTVILVNLTDSVNNRAGNSDKMIPVVCALAGILSALIIISIGIRQIFGSSKGCLRTKTRNAHDPIFQSYDYDNSENLLDIENDGSIYSVIKDQRNIRDQRDQRNIRDQRDQRNIRDQRDQRNRPSSGIVSVELYQDFEGFGEAEAKHENRSCIVTQKYPGPVYEEVKLHESDLVVIGVDNDSMTYAYVERSKPQCDTGCTAGQKSNRAPQGKPKPKQNVGADGTIYTEINVPNEISSLHSSVRKQPKDPTFRKSLYAEIDHTIKSIPPPPK